MLQTIRIIFFDCQSSTFHLGYRKFYNYVLWNAEALPGVLETRCAEAVGEWGAAVKTPSGAFKIFLRMNK